MRITDDFNSAEAVLLNWSDLEAPRVLARAKRVRKRCVVYGRPMTPGAAVFVLEHGASAVIGDTDGLERIMRVLASPATPVEGPLASAIASVHLERRDHPKPTPRELQVLELVESDPTLHDVATKLGLSTVTVRNRLHRAMSKLAAPTRHDATSRARELGYLA